MNHKISYMRHKARAKRRGIPFELSYEDWLAIWLESGHLENRGRGNGKYVMARYWDSGPYKVGNVRIILAVDNTLEYWAKRRYQAAPRGPVMVCPPEGDKRFDRMRPDEILEALEDGLDI